MFFDKILKIYLKKYPKKNREEFIRTLRRILQEVKNISYNQTVFDNIYLSENEEKLLHQYTIRYLNHEPLSKIFCKKSFWKYDFYVDRNVLDPRPETEIIVESVLNLYKTGAKFNILDIGTGSGAIILSVLKEFPRSCGIGIDISADAVHIAQKNAQLLNVSNVAIKNLSIEGFLKQTNSLFDIVVSNPPYIVSDDIKKLDPSVKNFDPKIALDGGLDGLSFYRLIIQNAKILTKKFLILEIGYGQENDVKSLLYENNLNILEVKKDLNNIPRTVISTI